MVKWWAASEKGKSHIEGEEERNIFHVYEIVSYLKTFLFDLRSLNICILRVNYILMTHFYYI